MTSPGTDGPSRQARLDEVLAEYMECLDRGEAGARQRLLAEHPDLTEDLRRYFEDSDELEQLAWAAGPPAAGTDLDPDPALGPGAGDGGASRLCPTNVQ